MVDHTSMAADQLPPVSRPTIVPWELGGRWLAPRTYARRRALVRPTIKARPVLDYEEAAEYLARPLSMKPADG